MIFKQKVQPIGIQTHRLDFVSDTYIQSYIQKLLFPLTLLQYLIFPRYNIRHNFIASNDISTNIKWGCYTILLVILHIEYTLLTFINVTLNVNELLAYNLLLIYTLYCICFVCNATVVVIQSDINVKLVKNLQIIQTSLKTFKDERDGIITSWIYSLLIVLFYATYTSFQATLVEDANFISFFVTCLIVLSSDLSVIYIVRVICFLRKQINTWKSYLKFVSDFDVRASNEHERELILNILWNNLTKAYVAIADAYLICEKITEFPIIFYVFVTCAQFLVYVQILITTPSAVMIQILSLIWTVKNSILLTLICRECENVYMSLKDARIACILSLTEDDTSVADMEARQYLRRLVREECRPFSARGLFAINAVLPLRVLSIIATYTVVILQFNFL